jgi:Undecaprenyl-phosphate galactose phosphotransferase WbaP
VTFAALLLVGLSSLMLALVWLVRRDGKPAFYRHKRVGAGGRAFHCIKFRSMIPDADRVLAELLMRDPNAAAEWEATQKLRHDPRVTSVGRFLRKTSLDELPQLLNVLRGEMSLVGPRPIVTAETRFYGEHISHYHATRPGITGLWQVSGRSDTTYERRVQLDVLYVRNWTFWNDIIILLRTVPIVMLRRGAV